MSFRITGDIISGWQLLLETLLLPEPRNKDSQELDHSLPKLLQTFSEAAEQRNLIKVKNNPPFILNPSQHSLSFLFQSQITASCSLLTNVHHTPSKSTLIYPPAAYPKHQDFSSSCLQHQIPGQLL